MQAAVDHNRSVACADSGFTLAPVANGRNLTSNEGTDATPDGVVEANQTHSTAARIEIGGQRVELDQGGEILTAELAICHLSCGQNAVRDRLFGRPRQHCSPVKESKLREGHDGDRK